MAENYYVNSKGERVYGYTKKPSDTPTVKITAPKSKVGKTASKTADDYYTAVFTRQNQLLLKQLEEAEKRRKQAMETAIQQNNRQAREDLQQAYILNMLQQKNLGQKLKNQGLTGGASETVTADIMNTYANNRNKINRARLAANLQAQTAYNSGTSTAYQKYLSNQSRLLKSAFLGANKSQQQSLYNYLKSKGLA